MQRLIFNKDKPSCTHISPRVTNFDRKHTIRNKIHTRESKLLKQNNKEEKEILPFVTQYQPSVSTIKEA